MTNFRFITGVLALLALSPLAGHASARSGFSMEQMLHYPFASELAAAEHGDAQRLDGARPELHARQGHAV